MIARYLLVVVAMTLMAGPLLAEDAPVATKPASRDSRCYELRIYTAADGKLDALLSRFREHTCKLFEKHGMTNVGYWTPLENPDRKLIYVLSYPDRDAREKSWKEFQADPDWKSAQQASEKDGKLVTKVDNYFLHATDFSPALKISAEGEPRTFELRTYTATPGNLEHLHERFRDHTIDLFTKHGMTNMVYWNRDKDQKDADHTLVYLLAHKTPEARKASFAEFGDDPAWKEVREASEKAAGGSLTVKDGVQSVLMKPTDFSPLK